MLSYFSVIMVTHEYIYLWIEYDCNDYHHAVMLVQPSVAWYYVRECVVCCVMLRGAAWCCVVLRGAA